MNVLAIDQGTSATKALVIAPDGIVLGEGQAPVTPRAIGSGEVVQDPGELLESVVEAGRTALRAAGTTVSAVGLGNQGETVLVVTDAATASRTMLLDLDRGAWSDEACEVFGLARDRRPEVVANATVVGETTAFGGRLPLSALIVDQQAALFAQSCFDRGEAKCTYGTGAFILANAGPDAPRSRSRLAACVAWQLQDGLTYCLDGQIYTAGAAVSWLRELGLIAGAADLDRRAPAGPPSADAPIFVPALAGMGAPHWTPDARGAWLGLSLATRSDDLVGAVLWGIAAQVATLAGAIGRDLGRPLTRLRVDGGLSRSERLMQAQADLLQVPVERYPSPDATALGIGALARIGAGETSSMAAAVGTWTPSAVFIAITGAGGS